MNQFLWNFHSKIEELVKQYIFWFQESREVSTARIDMKYPNILWRYSSIGRCYKRAASFEYNNTIDRLLSNNRVLKAKWFLTNPSTTVKIINISNIKTFIIYYLQSTSTSLCLGNYGLDGRSHFVRVRPEVVFFNSNIF